jgi:hypothetical protein
MGVFCLVARESKPRKQIACCHMRFYPTVLPFKNLFVLFFKDFRVTILGNGNLMYS